MENSSVIRRSSGRARPARKLFTFIVVILLVAAGVILMALSGEVRKAWLATDFATQTREDLVRDLPGVLDREEYFAMDIWDDNSGLIGRSLLVFYSDEETVETFTFRGQELENWSVGDAIIAYHVTLPFIGYWEFYSQWIYYKDG